MTIRWNEVTIWWNEVAKGWNEVVWNEVVWNEVVMERSNRIPLRIDQRFDNTLERKQKTIEQPL